MALYERDADVHSSIEHFISAYAICTDNRGLLIHSRIMGIRTDENSLIATKKSRKSGEMSVYEFPIEVIRRVADEVQFWRGYGGHICAYLSRRDLWLQKLPKGMTPVGPATLPQKSSLPINLMANSPGKGKKPPRQPQS